MRTLFASRSHSEFAPSGQQRSCGPVLILALGLWLFLATPWPGSGLAHADASVQAKRGTAFTVDRTDREAFSQPTSMLSPTEHRLFLAGRGLFRRPWAAVTSLNGDWGLGPTFNADRCSACHVNNGRGLPPRNSGEQTSALLVRLSIPGHGEHGGPKPHPDYGEQIQNYALDGSSQDLANAGIPVEPEAQVFLDWQERTLRFADGETATLRWPTARLEKLAFGALGDQVMLSLRNAPPVVGMGLLEAIPEATLEGIAAQQRALGYNGRLNRVWDAIGRRMVAGRFGWKANQASLREQSAKASIEDMGVSSRYFPEQNCPLSQPLCRRLLPANSPELATVEIDALVFWLRALAVPAPRAAGDPEVMRGQALFAQAQCAVCHVPELRTAARHGDFPALADQPVRAFTDLLLHDMGEGLADQRPDYEAGGRDWRTAPLWGLGLTATVSGELALLHDGRARSLTEAILWHGGEAARAREIFLHMRGDDRRALLCFLESL